MNFCFRPIAPAMTQDSGSEVRYEPARLLSLVDSLLTELRPGSSVRSGLDSQFERDLGLDSLARVELLARVERDFQIRIPAEALGTATCPRDLLAEIQTLVPGAAPAGQDSAQLLAPEHAQGAQDTALTLLEVLDWHVARHPDRIHATFYCDENTTETLSYAQLAEAGARVAAALQGKGVVPGQCVALMLPSGLDFFRCFFGILMCGAVPVPMYPPARPAQVEDHLRRQAGILRNCEARVLVTFDAVRPIAGVLTGLAPDLCSVVVPAELNDDPVRPPPLGAEDLALIQYTSGSTGDPKGVMLSHANLLANIRAWGRAIGLGSTDVAVSWLPLYHDMGLIGAWLGSLYHASPLVLMSPLDFLSHPERWLWAVHRHRGTVTAAPNFAFDLCVKRLADQTFEGMDLSSWRLAANGAEPVNADTLARFASCFAPYGLRPEILAPVYGLAECSVGLAVPPPGRGVRIDWAQGGSVMLNGRAEPAASGDPGAMPFVCCGPPLPGHALRVVDDKGAVLAERCIGSLEFRGPSATRGYYRNPALTATLMHDDWLITGDYAYLADGELYITGRQKDLIIRGGRNFYPYDMEYAIGGIAGVRKGCVAVFGVTDAPGTEERLVVVAETREQGAAARHELAQHIVGVAVAQLGLPPDDVVLVPPHSVLKTSSGKIRRTEMREAYLRGRLGVTTRAPWLQVVRLYAAGLSRRVRRSVGHLMRWLYGAWVWLCFGLIAPLAALAIWVLPTLEARWAVVHRLARGFRVLTACSLTVTGTEHLPTTPAVLVANHASYADGLLLGAALRRPVRFVAKAEFKESWLMRSLFERMGACFVTRSDVRQGVEDTQVLSGLARAMPPLLFFAEGTFSARAGLMDFRLGAFQVALQNALPVVPLVIAGTRQVLPDGSWRPRRGPLSVTVCPPILPAGESWHDLLVLRDAARAAVLQHCGEPDRAMR